MRQARSRRRCQAFPAHPKRTSLLPLLPATYLRGRHSQRADRVDRPIEPAGRGRPRQPLQGRRGHRYLAAALQALPLHLRRKTDCRESKYDLWVTAAERDAMTRVVATCPTMALPGPGSASTVATSPSNQPNRAPSIQPAPAPAPPASGVSYRNLLRLVRRCCPDYSRATRLLTQARPRRRRYRLRMTQDWQDTAP